MRSPLTAYRRAQLRARREFDSFTRIHCPACPAPCCMKPARITPLDVVLARETGWRPPDHVACAEGARDSAEASAIHYLGAALPDNAPEPCDYLGPKGCTFPEDLRPCGCTLYICPTMREVLDRKRLARLKRAVREVRQAYEDIVACLTKSRPHSLEETG